MKRPTRNPVLSTAALGGTALVAAVQTLLDSDIDWSALVGIAVHADWKFWVLAVLFGADKYLAHRDDKLLAEGEG